MYIIIVNQVAGSGRGWKVFNKIKQDDLYSQNDCRAFLTEYEGHAEKLAEQLANLYGNRITAFIVIGGDGTINEVLNGLSDYRNIPLSFVPAGSGNDFAKGHKITGNLSEILHEIIVGKTSKSFWPGKYITNNRNINSTRLFANSIGFGFDAEIVRATNKSFYKYWLNKLNLGSFSYVIALLDVLRSFKPKSIELTMDGNTEVLNDVWMITIANHAYYGGGMKIIPDAKIQPNGFPILVIRKISVWKVLLLFFTVFFGKHIHFKEVTTYYASTVSISTKDTIFYQVDGQLGSCTTCHISKQSDGREVIGTTT